MGPTTMRFLSPRPYERRPTEGRRALISVVIPTLNAAVRLGACLEALAGPAMDGMVRQVIVVDGGSSDETLKIAEGFGAKILSAPPGRGGQMKAGAAVASSGWLLFLHGDTVLEPGWVDEARLFIEKNTYDAGVFTLAFDAKGFAPKFVAAGAMIRTRYAKSPYGDQGLFMSKATYEEIGGYKDLPLFEDVEILRRLMQLRGRHALHVFGSKAVTSARRYEEEGYLRRVFKNALLLTRYQLGASPEKLSKAYR